MKRYANWDCCSLIFLLKMTMPTTSILRRKHLQVLSVVDACFFVSERSHLGWGYDLLMGCHEMNRFVLLQQEKDFACSVEQLQILKAEVTIRFIKKMVSNTIVNISKTLYLYFFFLIIALKSLISCSLRGKGKKKKEFPFWSFREKKKEFFLFLLYTFYHLLWYLLERFQRVVWLNNPDKSGSSHTKLPTE